MDAPIQQGSRASVRSILPDAPVTRRVALTLGLGCLVAASGLRGTTLSEAYVNELRALERSTGGRLGVYGVDVRSGATLAHRARERFAMCSTHKLLVGAAVLAAVERGRLRLHQFVPYGRSDLLEYAPVTSRNVARGAMTVAALCEAALRWSDNTADNLLLGLIGGPAGWTDFARSLGDSISRLDRVEPDLNSAQPKDPRDTSTPAAMTEQVRTLLLGDTLNAGSRRLLTRWLLNSPITTRLFRAGVPEGWHVADKSGSGSFGTRNDIGIIYPPSGAPLLLSVFLTETEIPTQTRETVLARCAALAVEAFTQQDAQPKRR